MPDPLGKRMTAAKSSGRRKPKHRGPARFPGCCSKRKRTKELAGLRGGRTSNVSIRRAAWLQLRAAIRPTLRLRHGSITEQATTSTFPHDDDRWKKHLGGSSTRSPEPYRQGDSLRWESV